MKKELSVETILQSIEADLEALDTELSALANADILTVKQRAMAVSLRTRCLFLSISMALGKIHAGAR